jgi:hypothetical protein
MHVEPEEQLREIYGQQPKWSAQTKTAPEGAAIDLQQEC